MLMVLVPNRDHAHFCAKDWTTVLEVWQQTAFVHRSEGTGTAHRSRSEHILAWGLCHDRQPRIDRVEGGSSQQ